MTFTIFLESYTLIGDSLHKFIEKLFIIIDFQIRRIEMKELALQGFSGSQLHGQSHLQQGQKRRIEMKELAPHVFSDSQLRERALHDFSDSQSQLQQGQQEQRRRMMQNDELFKKRSKQNKLRQSDEQFKDFHIVEQRISQIQETLLRQQEGKGKTLYDLLRMVDISDIVLVEEDFPEEKTFVNRNKLVEAFNNTALQEEDTIFDIIIGYFLLKLKVKLLNSEKRENISEEDTQYFKNQLHAICRDPVPLKAKIINMSNIIIYFLTVPNSITTQLPLENTAVSSTTSLGL